MPWNAVQDALDNWERADADQREILVRTMDQRFAQSAVPRRVLSLSVRMWFASLVNYAICQAAAADAAEAWYAGGQRALQRWNKERYPKIVKEVRDKFSPVHEELIDSLYDEVQKGAHVPDQTKRRLKELHGDYLKLKKEAESITAPTIRDFIDRTDSMWKRLEGRWEPLLKEVVAELEKEI